MRAVVMIKHLISALLAAFICATLNAQAQPSAEEAAAIARWERSPHGEFLKRLLPPAIHARELPEPQSEGARLTLKYCVQCHYLASPAMHARDKWPQIINRMLPRMEGRGNLGTTMKELMVGMQAPTLEEARVLTAYHERHAQKRIDMNALPEANKTMAWWSYREACSQCHTLPDPQRHRAREWPGVVKRCESHMAWMNRVVGSKADPREPQLRIEEITAYLQKYARK